MMTFKELRLAVTEYFETHDKLICSYSDDSGAYASIRKAKVKSKGQTIDGWLEEDFEGNKTAFKHLKNAVVQALRDSCDPRFEDEMFIDGENWDQNADRCFCFDRMDDNTFSLFESSDFE